MNVLELIAALLGVASVGLVVLRNVWAFPIGIVMVLLYAWIFWEQKFYSDMGLQFVFAVMQAQGWYLWSRGDRADDNKIAVSMLSTHQWAATAVFQVLGTWGLGYTMSRFTDASLPWIDAFTTTLSLAAQWWMNKRYVDNWTLWIVADAIYLYQYSAKGLYLTTALYAIFLGMAIFGYREWKRKLAA
jgi:nicotinamide mononucleotide transporter